MTVFAIMAGLSVPPQDNLPAMGPHDAFLLRRYAQPGDPPPCQRLVEQVERERLALLRGDGEPEAPGAPSGRP